MIFHKDKDNPVSEPVSNNGQINLWDNLLNKGKLFDEGESEDDIYQEDIFAKGNRAALPTSTSDQDGYEHSDHMIEKDADLTVRQDNVEHRISEDVHAETATTKMQKERVLYYEQDSNLGPVQGEEMEREVDEPDGQSQEVNQEVDSKATEAMAMKEEVEIEKARQREHAKHGVFLGILKQLGEDIGMEKNPEHIPDGQQVNPNPVKTAGYEKPQPELPTQSLPGQEDKK